MRPLAWIADSSPDDFATRSRPQRRTPAQASRNVAETVEGTCDPIREADYPRFTPTEPVAVLANHFGKGKLLRPCKVEPNTGRCAGSKKKQNSVSDIVELNNLQESSVRHDGEDRQGSKAAK